MQDLVSAGFAKANHRETEASREKRASNSGILLRKTVDDSLKGNTQNNRPKDPLLLRDPGENRPAHLGRIAEWKKMIIEGDAITDGDTPDKA